MPLLVSGLQKYLRYACLLSGLPTSMNLLLLRVDENLELDGLGVLIYVCRQVGKTVWVDDSKLGCCSKYLFLLETFLKVDLIVFSLVEDDDLFIHYRMFRIFICSKLRFKKHNHLILKVIRIRSKPERQNLLIFV